MCTILPFSILSVKYFISPNYATKKSCIAACCLNSHRLAGHMSSSIQHIQICALSMKYDKRLNHYNQIATWVLILSDCNLSSYTVRLEGDDWIHRNHLFYFVVMPDSHSTKINSLKSITYSNYDLTFLSKYVSRWYVFI